MLITVVPELWSDSKILWMCVREVSCDLVQRSILERVRGEGEGSEGRERGHRVNYDRSHSLLASSSGPPVFQRETLNSWVGRGEEANSLPL